MICLSSYLWFKNEKEILKKLILAEAYEEVKSTSFNDLGKMTTLMAAIEKQLRGVDYPSDVNLKLNENEVSRYKDFVIYYKHMYLDAFVAAEECEALAALADPMQTKEEENDNVVESLKSGPEEDKSELIVLKCFHNWMQNN